MEVYWQWIAICAGVAGMLGPVAAIVIRQLSGPAMWSARVAELDLRCFSDNRGIRVVCENQVILATTNGVYLSKAFKGAVNGKKVVVKYRGGIPKLAIFVEDRRVTKWPFDSSEWWARFLAEGWPFLSLLIVAAVVGQRFFW